MLLSRGRGSLSWGRVWLGRGSQERERTGGPELRPKHAFPHLANQQKDWYLTSPDPSAGNRHTGLTMGPSTTMHPDPMPGSGPVGSVPNPNCK